MLAEQCSTGWARALSGKQALLDDVGLAGSGEGGLVLPKEFCGRRY